SECSQAARQQACELAERFHAELHLLHVLPDPLLLAPEPGFAMPVPSEYILQLEADARRALDGVVPREWASGRLVVRQVRHGNPANEIVRYADEQRIRLIVVGTHGRGALGHLFMGSVAERVVRLAACPVLTVGQKVVSAAGAPAAPTPAATVPGATVPATTAANSEPASTGTGATTPQAACGPSACGSTPCAPAAGSENTKEQVPAVVAAPATAATGPTPAACSTETTKPPQRERKVVKAGK
ncbi:MAG: universal stress protein, partial [Planctomycetaceae bacterium]